LKRSPEGGMNIRMKSDLLEINESNKFIINTIYVIDEF